MSDPIGTISGLSSGVQWRDLLDQISAADRSRTLGQITAAQSSVASAQKGWNDFRSVAARLAVAAKALAAPDALRLFTASATPTSSGDSAVRAAASATASPGSFSVSVRSLAAAEKLGGAAFASSTTALGVSGVFAVNGRAITVDATDSLTALRDKLVAADSGTSPSGVSATVVRSTTGYRLVLTSDSTGRAGIDLTDTSAGTLAALGFSDGTTVTNVGDAGAVQSARFRSADAAVAELLGATAPAAATITVAGRTVAIDTATDSLTDLAARITSAVGDASAARVVSESISGVTWYRLESNVAISADGTVSQPDSAQALGLLGVLRGGRAGTAQVLVSSNSFSDAVSGLEATSGTLLTDLQASGGTLGIGDGDSLRISGRRGDGTAVSTTVAISASTTLGDVLSALNAASGFGSGTRPATATLSSGRLILTDDTAGESMLTLSLGVATVGGDTVALGAFDTGHGGQAGVSRVLVTGADADATIDGQRIQSNANTLTDAVAGVSLSLLQATPGESLTVSVAQDSAGVNGLVKEFVTSYNALRTFVKTATASGGVLRNNATVRSIASSLTSSLTGTLTGLSGVYTAAPLVGLQHDANGVLSLTESTLSAALAADFDAARAVLSLRATPSSADVSFVSASTATKASDTPYAVDITRAATLATVTGAAWNTYATTGTPDTMTVLDAATGVSTNLTLNNGDSIANVAARLNASFALSRMHLTAAVDNSQLTLQSTDYGATGGFTVSYAPGSGDGTASLGIAAQAYVGLDVAGTINGATATGRGQLLTGGTGDNTEGLVLRYTGATAGAMGTVQVSLGVGGLVQQLAEAVVATGTGSVDQQLNSLTAQSDRLGARASRAEQMLAERRAALTRQFIAMEAAMAKAQSLGMALGSALNTKQN